MVFFSSFGQISTVIHNGTAFELFQVVADGRDHVLAFAKNFWSGKYIAARLLLIQENESEFLCRTFSLFAKMLIAKI